MMKDIMGLMKQAQAMQSRMQDLQAQLEQVEVEGQAGAGSVRVSLTAKGAMRSISIDPALLVASEKELIEDLIVTAHEDARRKGEALVQERMQAITAGLPLPPGMKLPF
jgi:DNA-binding YbaB/EbfC family protein